MTNVPIYMTDDEIITVTTALETLGNVYGRSYKDEERKRKDEFYRISSEIKSQHLLGQCYAKFTANLTADADKIRSGRTV